MASITVRPGTDTRYPSYRVTIHDQPDKDGSTDREIALVFRKGEPAFKQREAIDRAVKDYRRSRPQLHPTLLGDREL